MDFNRREAQEKDVDAKVVRPRSWCSRLKPKLLNCTEELLMDEEHERETIPAFTSGTKIRMKQNAEKVCS